jgi:hypothetical protein
MDILGAVSKEKGIGEEGAYMEDTEPGWERRRKGGWAGEFITRPSDRYGLSGR